MRSVKFAVHRHAHDKGQWGTMHLSSGIRFKWYMLCFMWSRLCWDYFAFSWTQFVEVAMRQEGYAKR